MKPGASRTAVLGQTSYQAIPSTSRPQPSARSTSGVVTAPSGSNRRGKYTFVINPTLATSEPLDTVNAAEKYCQTSTLANAKIGYGRRSDGKFAYLPKTSVYTTVGRIGCSSAQPPPMTVCL